MVGAHGASGFDEADVALDGRFTHPQDAYAAARLRRRCQRAQCNEIAGRRGVGFHMHHARRAEAAAGRDDEALPAIALHRDAEPRQQVQRNFDVGARDQLADDLDHDVIACAGCFALRQRQRHQQGGQKLAGDVAANAYRIIKPQRRGADVKRWIAFNAGTGDAATELAQGIHQVADGALVHARHTTQFKVAAEYGKRRREGPHRGAGVAQKQPRGRGRAALAQSCDRHSVAVSCHPTAELRQRGQHDPGVVGIEQIVDDGGAVAQRGQQQHTVGDALGARQRDLARRRCQRRKVQKFGRVHGRKRALTGWAA